MSTRPFASLQGLCNCEIILVMTCQIASGNEGTRRSWKLARLLFALFAWGFILGFLHPGGVFLEIFKWSLNQCLPEEGLQHGLLIAAF